MSRGTTELFLGGLSRDVRRADLEDIFSRYGKITRCDIKYVNGYAGTAYGFVGYEDDRDAEDAIKNENGRKVCGSAMVIERSKTKAWKTPSRITSSRDRYPDRSSDYGYKRRSRSPRKSTRRSRSRSRSRESKRERPAQRSSRRSKSRSSKRSSKLRSRSKSRDRRPRDTKRSSRSGSRSRSRSFKRSSDVKTDALVSEKDEVEQREKDAGEFDLGEEGQIENTKSSENADIESDLNEENGANSITINDLAAPQVVFEESSSETVAKTLTKPESVDVHDAHNEIENATIELHSQQDETNDMKTEV